MRFCRAPQTADYAMSGVHYKAGHELDRLREVFPDISSQLAGKLVVDFGCAFGYQSVAFSRCGARRVVGIEIEEASLQAARKLVMEQDLAAKVTFEKRIAKGLNADVIVILLGAGSVVLPLLLVYQAQRRKSTLDRTLHSHSLQRQNVNRSSDHKDARRQSEER